MECKNWDLMRENWRLQLLLTIYRWLCKSVYVFGLSIYVKFRIIFINFGLLFHRVENKKKNLTREELELMQLQLDVGERDLNIGR